MWAFQHPDVERAFLLHYQGPTVPYGLASAVISLLLVAFKAVTAAVLQTACVLDGQLWWRIAAAAYMPLLYLIMGRERYILYFGVSGLWIRLVFAAGWITGPRPGGCSYRHCALLWHHRLLAIHAASVLHRIQSGWYWLGGAMSWLVAAAVEVADPEYACPASMSCLIAGLQASAATPAALLQNILQAALRSSKVAAVDVVLPGLLLTWLELRARKAWWQKQLQQQRPPVAATADAAAAAAGCAAQLSKQEDILEHYLEEQHLNMQLVTGSRSCTSAHTDAPVAVELPRQQQRGNSQALTEHCSMQHARQFPSTTTGSAEVPAVAEPDRSRATAEPPDAGALPKQQQPKEVVGRSPAGVPGTWTDSSCTQHNAEGSTAESQNTPIAAMKQSATASGAATDSASLLSCATAQMQDAPAEAAPPVEGSTADSTVSSSITGQVLPAPLLTAAAPALAPAAPAPHAVGPAAAAAEPPQQQLKPKRASALYVSPLEGVVVSFKFNEYPGKGLVAIKRFQHQLAAAVEEAAMAAASGRTPQPLEGPGSAVAAWVTSTAAFPGCFQVAMHLALPRGQVYGSPDIGQIQLLQGIQCAAQQMADAWPDCKGLIDVQLKLLQEQQLQQQPMPAGGLVTHATPTAEITAARAADTDTFSTAGWPVVCSPANHGSSYGISVLPVAVVAPSLDTSATTTLQVELCIPGRVVEQLSAAGQRSIRVVVAPQLPTGGVLVDTMYKLPGVLNRRAPGASMRADQADMELAAPSLDADSAAQTETALKGKAASVVDGSPQLLSAPHKQNPANAAAGEGTEGMALASLTSGYAAGTAPATALAEAADDWHVPLQIPWSPSTHLVLQQLQVLTSVVLAGHVEKLDKLSSSGRDSAATAAAVSAKPLSSPVSATAPNDAAAAAASLHGVIAELPLLVLPEGPASELHKLFETTVAEGASASDAYAEMLPLLRDMTAALCVATGSSYTNLSYPSYGSITGQNGMPSMLLEALSVFLVQHDMQSCEQLLDAVNSCQQFGRRMSGGVGLQGIEGDDDSSKGAAGKGGSKTNDDNNNSAGGRTDYDRALDNSCAVLSGSSSSSADKTNECSDRPGTASGSCDSMPSARASDLSSTTSLEIHKEIHKGVSCSGKTGDEKAPPARKAATPVEAWDALDFEHSLQASGALRVSLRTVLFGFPSAAVEAAYLKFRAARLHLLDFVFVATGPAAVILPVVQLLLLLWSGFAAAAAAGAAAGSFNVDRILALILRTVGVGTHWLAHAAVWGANSGIAFLQPLRQWRSAALLAGIGFVMSVTVAFKMRGGVWAKAASDVLQDFRGTFLGLCLHRDLLYPLFACTEIVPYNIVFVFMQFVLFDRLFERPAVPGFGHVGSTAFLVLAQQAFAIAVEASLRKRFVRHVQAAYP